MLDLLGVNNVAPGFILGLFWCVECYSKDEMKTVLRFHKGRIQGLEENFGCLDLV